VIKHLAPFLAAAAVASVAHAETRSVDVGAFTAVDAANGVDVRVKLGEPASVIVEGPADRIGDVDVTLNKNVLRIRPAQRGWFEHAHLEDVTVRVTAESLSAVEVANGAHVAVVGAPAESELQLAAANGGAVEVDGGCKSVAASAARGGVVDASRLDCKTANASASMGGVVKVRASASISASAAMGGVVETHGNAEAIASSASMGGVVSRDE
jgi:hypothetical protein